jgi:UDP-2,3-diacylglucosamine pyrophosphatase LpxH
MKNTLLLSDIHLGDPDFDYEEQLDLLLSTLRWQAIYIVGDLLDTWESRLFDILTKYNRLIGVINSVSLETPLIIIKGNHDPDALTLQEIFPHAAVFGDEAYFKIGTHDCVLCHGDKVDPANWCLKPLFDFYQWIIKTFGKESFVFRAADWIRKRFYGIPKKLWAVQDSNAIDRWAGLEEVDTIIVGHTHAAKMLQTTTITYLNIGVMLPPNPTYAIHNAETDTFELHAL